MPLNSGLIERLVLNGGGAKGVGYPGVCQALHDTGIFNKAHSISGASIGSIFAAMMAVGTNPEVLRQKYPELNLVDLIGNITWMGPNIIPGLTRSLEPVEKFLNQHLIDAASGFLKKQPALSEDIQHLLQEILADGHQFSFDDLHRLHKEYPGTFKKLTIVAATMGRYKLSVFDHQKDTKNISISRACIASSAMPVIFAPVKINGIYYQDGGVIDPLPSESFLLDDSNESPEERFKKTLLFVFYFSFFNDAVNKKEMLTPFVKSVLILGDILLFPLVNLPYYLINLTFFILKCVAYLLFIIPYLLICSNYHQISTVFSDMSDVFFSLFSIPVVFCLSTLANSLYTRIREQYSDRTILLDSGSISSNDFSVEPIVSKTMHALYYLETMEHLIKHELHDGSFIANEYAFYEKILNNYDFFSTSSDSEDLNRPEDMKSRYLKIKQIANENHTSPTALTLTKATEQLYKRPCPIDSKEEVTHQIRFFGGERETENTTLFSTDTSVLATRREKDIIGLQG